MKTSIAGSVLFLLFSGLSPSSALAAEFIGMAPEKWTGVTDEYGVTSFKGIPFAAAPVGENRWLPPQPYQPQTANHLADEYAPACMQNSGTENRYRRLIEALGEDPEVAEPPEGGYSEDCLYLNVWSGNMGGGDKQPVMVWIHGGGNSGGWAYEPNYRGHVLANEDIVYVSIPYRVNIFGNFSHPDLLSEQNGKAGNYGLLDIIAALEWVQQHIAEFGGDANNVTLFGESAGAANIAFLMASAQAKGLFHRAIHQSAGYQQHEQRTLEDLTASGVTFSRALQADSITDLRELDSSALMQAMDQNLADFSFGSVIGGHALEQAPYDVFTNGQQARVPLLIGTNAHELLMYQTEDGSLDQLAQNLGIEDKLSEIRSLLTGLPDIGQRDRLSTASRMLCPSQKMAEAVSLSNQGAYVYHFTRVRSGSQWDKVGAYHGAEIPYIFNTHDAWLDNDPIDYALTATVQDYWVNFARNGDPNNAGLPTWSSYNPDNPGVLNISDSIGMKAAPDTALCELLEE